MKKVLFHLIFGGLLTLAACDNLKKQVGEEQINTVPAPKESNIDIPVSALATNKDYVCGMTVEAGQIADTAHYESKIYGFCSKECKAEFMKNPQSYLTQK